MSIDELQPDFVALLGQCAYLELSLFESASGIAARASDLAARESLTRVTAAVLQKHHDLVDLMTVHRIDPAEAMQPFVADVDRFRRRIGDSTWAEAVLSLHLTSGLLDDFFSRLAGGLPGAEGDRVIEILSRDIGHDALETVLRAAIAQDQRILSTLALWGRRLVGDTLLVARSALDRARTDAGEPLETDERRVEPVLTELVAAHSRRMDRLGLTA